MEKSKLSKEEFIDKIRGLVFGAALGDAFGLATEFMDKNEAKKEYGKGEIQFGTRGTIPFRRDSHRSRWVEGDWTDDTDQLLLILLSFAEGKSTTEADYLDFAKRLKNWAINGFEEFGDYGGFGIGFTVLSCLNSPDFLRAPHNASQKIWEENGKNLAANGAIMRTSILGVPSFWDEDVVKQNSINIARVTHADGRAVASAVAASLFVSRIISEGNSILKEKEKLINHIEEKCSDLLLEEHKQEFHDYLYPKSLSGLKLDDKQAIGYALKVIFVYLFISFFLLFISFLFLFILFI